LLAVAEAIATRRDLPALFHQMAVQLGQVVQFDALSVVLHEAATDTMRLHVLETGEPFPPGSVIILPTDEDPEQTPGAIVKVLLDTEHWLSAGTDGEIGVLVEGNRVFGPITLDRGRNVGRYAEEDELVLSGIVWEAARPQLASKAFLIHQPVGRGQVIAFAEDPNYRAYAEATELLFMNAVLLGPGR